MELSSGNVFSFSVAGEDKRENIGLFSEPVILYCIYDSVFTIDR